MLIEVNLWCSWPWDDSALVIEDVAWVHASHALRADIEVPLHFEQLEIKAESVQCQVCKNFIVSIKIEKGIFEGLIGAESSSSLPNSSGTGAASVSDPNPGAFLAQNSHKRLRANHSHPCLPTGYHTPSPVPLQLFRF